MGARIIGGKIFRDPAEFVEAAHNIFNEQDTGTTEPEESIEDLIREAAHPAKLTVAAVERMKVLMATREPVEPVATPQMRADMLREFLEKFNPANWTLLNWWAIQFAIEAPSTEGLTERRVCSLLSVGWMRFYRAKKRWRETFNFPKNIHAHKESTRVAWRFRDRRQHAKAIKKSWKRGDHS